MDYDELWQSLSDELHGWAIAAVRMVPRIVLAVVAGVAFYLVAKLVRKGVAKALARTRMNAAARDLIASLSHFAALVAALMITLSILDLNRVVTSLLAGAGVVGLALGFAFQDLAANFISGIGLSMRHPFKLGDIIETDEVCGVVEQLHLRTTIVRTFDGKRVVVPNKKLYQSVLINHTDNDLKRMDLECGVGYGSDLEQVRRVALEALGAIEPRSSERDPAFYFTGFGDSSIDFVAHVWFDYAQQTDLLACRSEAILALKRAFDENDIVIPFPIRTLDFDPNGGTTLEAMWPEAVTERGATDGQAQA